MIKITKCLGAVSDKILLCSQINVFIVFFPKCVGYLLKPKLYLGSCFTFNSVYLFIFTYVKFIYG